jgi:translation initiation factor IF-2
VTVKQLAETVGRPVETLLTQMQEAGLSHTSATDAVSDVEKQQLLAHLKRAHGESDSEPKKITLKRKETSTLKVAPSAGGKAKTVNVEVRKTRSYVKRSVLDEQEDAAREAEEAARKLEEERLAAEAAARKAEEDARSAAAEEEARKAAEEARRASDAASKGAKDKKLSVPKVGAAAAKPREESAEERAKREAEEARLKAAEDVRRKQEEKLRLEAEEKARQKTLEQARKIAEDIGVPWRRKRCAGDRCSLWRAVLVGKAYEDSFAREDREIRRGGGNKAGGKSKGGKKREEEQAFRPVTRTLSSSHCPSSMVLKSRWRNRCTTSPSVKRITVADLAQKMALKAKVVIKVLMKMGEVVTANQSIDQATAGSGGGRVGSHAEVCE